MGLLTLNAAKDAIAEAANINASDTTRIAKYANDAVRRLIPKGDFVGTFGRYRICTAQDCLTWPRSIEAIRGVAVSTFPIGTHNGWYEFMQFTAGVLNSNKTNTLELLDRVTSPPPPTFNDITQGATNRKVQVVAAVSESASAKITLQGYDQNGQWIRTQVSGTWIDGEQVTISTTETNSTNYFTKLVRVIKPVTNGAVRLYEYNNTSAAVVKQLAYYEPDETLPNYRRSYIPALNRIAAGCNANCSEASVEVLAKLNAIPVSGLNDFLQIGNLPALVEEVRAIRKFENNLFAEGVAQEKLAVRYLNEELRNYDGLDSVASRIDIHGAANCTTRMIAGVR